MSRTLIVSRCSVSLAGDPLENRELRFELADLSRDPVEPGADALQASVELELLSHGACRRLRLLARLACIPQRIADRGDHPRDRGRLLFTCRTGLWDHGASHRPSLSSAARLLPLQILELAPELELARRDPGLGGAQTALEVLELAGQIVRRARGL